MNLFERFKRSRTVSSTLVWNSFSWYLSAFLVWYFLTLTLIHSHSTIISPPSYHCCYNEVRTEYGFKIVPRWTTGVWVTDASMNRSFLPLTMFLFFSQELWWSYSNSNLRFFLMIGFSEDGRGNKERPPGLRLKKCFCEYISISRFLLSYSLLLLSLLISILFLLLKILKASFKKEWK